MHHQSGNSKRDTWPHRSVACSCARKSWPHAFCPCSCRRGLRYLRRSHAYQLGVTKMANFAHDAIEQFKRLPAGGKIAVGIAFVAVAAIGYLEYSRSKNQPTTPAVDTTGATTSTDLTGTGATLPPTTNPPVTTTPPQPVSPGACPPGMHRGSTSGLCKCDGKNMINKGDHCIPKKGSKKGS